MIRHMEKGRNEYSLETLPILVERLHEMLKETKVLDLHGEMGAGKRWACKTPKDRQLIA
jgi:tRNA A37 threonylcarbamoyladenosine biosynthesis protein TsaE